jgi:hypothetical protein
MPDSNSRTEALDDGTVAAWYTENDEEHSLGVFPDQRTADFAVGGALETVEARAAAAPAPKATAAPAPAAKKS